MKIAEIRWSQKDVPACSYRPILRDRRSFDFWNRLRFTRFTEFAGFQEPQGVGYRLRVVHHERMQDGQQDKIGCSRQTRTVDAHGPVIVTTDQRIKTFQRISSARDDSK